MKLMRVVVREDFSKNRCDTLVADIKLALQVLGEMDKRTMEKYQDHVRQHSSNVGKAKHNHPKYQNEKHSLAGKTGKTHAVC